jgi:hypothetical protein
MKLIVKVSVWNKEINSTNYSHIFEITENVKELLGDKSIFAYIEELLLLSEPYDFNPKIHIIDIENIWLLK